MTSEELHKTFEIEHAGVQFDSWDEYAKALIDWLEVRLLTATEEEEKWRKLLWLRHGCSIHALYGDDGEMQCSACGIDFKRRTADEINDHFIRQGSAKIADILDRLR